MLELKNIKKTYKVGDVVIQALDGLNLNFRRSEFVAILGPSGCGKTTTLNILGGLDQYSSGDLVIEGTSTKNYTDRNWDNYRNKRIGFVFQSYNLISHLTILGNVEIALTISGISVKERRQRAKEALIKVGLEKHLGNKPNQLSGGQAQRVAIARAIVNNPEIILLDEPTGALDSKTSVQILDLIKEVGQDKLVIMVTHNPELASQYADRIVKMADGVVVDDTNVFDGQDQEVVINQDKDNAKTKMSYPTAIKVSAKNLYTKKRRTLLTAFACAIGIMGIALILALTNGLNVYIDELTRNSVESSPITISAGNITQGEINFGNNLEEFPDVQEMFVTHTLRPRVRRRVPLGLQSFFDNYFDSDWYHEILKSSGMQVRMFSYLNNNWHLIQNDTGQFATLLGTSIMSQMLNHEFTYQLYEIVNDGGHLPSNKNEIALVVDQYNAITDASLIRLGLVASQMVDGNIVVDTEMFTFEEILDKEFKIPTNNQRFIQNEEGQFHEVNNANINWEEVHTVRITAILRQRPEVDLGIYSTGIVFPVELLDYLESVNSNSDVVRWMLENPLRQPWSNQLFAPHVPSITSPGNVTTRFDRWENHLRSIGGVPRSGLDLPSMDWELAEIDEIVRLEANAISIYPRSLEGKNAIIDAIHQFNRGLPSADRIVYVDLLSIIANVMTSMIDVIGYVLIGFTSISLVVSAVMISIITSISVLERTKEIGILRSIGARKKDVNRLFNAENIILGTLAGLLGVLVALGLVLIINQVLFSVLGVSNMARLTIIHVIILMSISAGISFLSGFVPARAAAKKDPVLALRAE